MRVSQAAAALAMCVQAAYAQPEPPLPPPRPAGSLGQAPQAAPNPAGSEHPQGAEADPCLTSLKAAGFEIEPAEPPKTGNELCRIELPVRLREVPVPSRPGASVRLTDEPILACRFAERFGHWIGDLAAP